VLSVFVLVGNPIIVLVIMGAMGYPRRVSFLSGLAVAQISEFSLILIALGRELGHVDNDIVGLVTLVGMITIAISTYMILYSHQIFERLDSLLMIFERRRVIDPPPDDAEPVDVIVYGYGRFGRHLVDRLARRGHRVLVVDWDPHARLQIADEALAAHVVKRFGDADDPEYPASLPIDSARWIVSTIPRVDTNKVLARSLRRYGSSARLAVTAHTAADVQRLAAEVADGSIDLVIEPFEDAAEAALVEFGER
jgi:voltage-gated potassium channel Kch